MSNYSDSQFSEENQNNSWYKAMMLIPGGSKVLDIGCSSGNFGRELIDRKKCTVDGFELDAKDAKIAAEKLRNVKVLNIEKDAIEGISERYDVIYFGDVIEHLIDPVMALKKVKSLLAPNGVVVFSLPNMAHVTVRLQLLKGDFDYSETGLLDKTHLHFYTMKELGTVFSEAGYEVVKLEFVEKDYPNLLIKDYLDDLGLIADKKFYDLMRQPDAAAFQFVGVAKPSLDIIPLKREQFGPIDFFESYYTNKEAEFINTKSFLQENNEALETKNTILEKKIKDYENHPYKNVVSFLKNRVKSVIGR